MKYVPMRRLAVWLVVIGALLAGTAANPLDAGAGSPASGTISLQGTMISGQQGKIVLAFAAPEGGGGPVARACWTIDSDAFGSSYTVMTEVPVGNPCGGQTADALLPGGVYTITVGVYQGGSQTPDKQVTLAMPVDGNAFPTFNGMALSVEPPGDATCDQMVDGQDVSGVLSGVADVGDEAPCLDSANVICTDGLNALDALALLVFKAVGLQSLIPGACPQLLAAPTLVSPPDGTQFDVFPRQTPVDWEPVPGATTYVLQTDYFGGCYPYGGWCSEAGWGEATYTAITETEYTFGFVSRGNGRWRVAAVDADGHLGPFSEWRTFEHLQ